MLQGMPYLALTIHSPNPETAKTNSHSQKKQKGRSVRSGLSSLFSVHVRCVLSNFIMHWEVEYKLESGIENTF